MSTHIRPKVRSKKDGRVDLLLEETRLKMKLLSTTTTTTNHTSTIPPLHHQNHQYTTTVNSTIEHEISTSLDNSDRKGNTNNVQDKPKGILKKSKNYSNVDSSAVSENNSNDYFHRFQNESLASELGLSHHHELMKQEFDGNDTMDYDNDQHSVKPLVKDMIVERKVGSLDATNIERTFHASAIEGHDAPISHFTIDTKTLESSSQNDMKVIGSLSELVEYANQVSDEAHENQAMIETDLDFSCFTKDDYDQMSQSARSLGISIEEYLERIKKEDDNDIEDNQLPNSDDEASNPYDENDDENDDDILDLFGASLEEEEILPAPALRPFMMIWNALSKWITPEAVLVLREFKNELFDDENYLVPDETVSPRLAPPEMSDIASSRAAGLMSMLKMNLSKCLTELGYKGDDGYTKRVAETRLSNFIQHFDYSSPMVQFHSDLWRAFTVILLDIVLPKYDIAYEGQSGKQVVPSEQFDDTVPISTYVTSIGISREEYKYLVTKAIPSLDSGAL